MVRWLSSLALEAACASMRNAICPLMDAFIIIVIIIVIVVVRTIVITIINAIIMAMTMITIAIIISVYFAQAVDVVSVAIYATT